MCRAILFVSCLAAAYAGRDIRFMGKASPRNDWLLIQRAHGAEMHEVVFAVVQRNLDQLEQIFLEVSNPKSSKYGQFLTYDQVSNLTSNLDATREVQNWLKSNRAILVSTSPRGDYIKARASVSVWEELFSTVFFQFSHAKQDPIVRAQEYSLPERIAEFVSGVHFTIQLPPRIPGKLVRAPVTASDPTMDPPLLNSYYNIASNDGKGLGSQSLFESLGQYYSPADLSQFQTLYDIPLDEVDEDIGGYESDSKCKLNPNNCAEANLDVQYMMAVAQDVPTTYWYDGAIDCFYDWIMQVAADSDPPLVHSISYGSIESELFDTIVNAFNTEAMKLGAQGVTIVVSSGDDGVANFQARDDASECGYNPSFPATSPYVTAIGATQGPEEGTTEIACQSTEDGLITTGGGFSTKFAAPSWQTSAVSTYFASLPSSEIPASGYNAEGRGYPDVSMAGRNYNVIIGGSAYLLSGTSASAPVVGGMISLVNSQRIAAGKSPLGFLNQAIYQNGGTFIDITSGKNNCCAGDSSQVCCTEGFYAANSWDPLTGFGSIDFAKFSATFASL